MKMLSFTRQVKSRWAFYVPVTLFYLLIVCVLYRMCDYVPVI